MFDRLVDILLQFLELFKCWAILEPYEGGIQTRLGKFVKVLEPGFYWLLPFGIDRTEREHMVPRTHSLGDQSVTTLDNTQVGFQAVITYKVRDIKVALLEVEDSEHAIKDSCAGTIGTVLAQCTWDEIRQSTDVLEKVTAACRKRGFRFGLEITSVQFATMGLTRTLRLLNK
jgi:regulator of protease activity HflC (stomatin/prohibitin superfamily)